MESQFSIPRESSLITKADMIDILLAASPEFTEKWEALRREWSNTADAPPFFLVLSDYARHVIGLLEAKDDERLRHIFDGVERLHVEGDRQVREAATVGLLENLQNINLHRTTTPDQFRTLLQPESLRWWDQLDLFWKGNPRSLAEDFDGEPNAG